jgi:hypothetical protein
MAQRVEHLVYISLPLRKAWPSRKAGPTRQRPQEHYPPHHKEYSGIDKKVMEAPTDPDEPASSNLDPLVM